MVLRSAARLMTALVMAATGVLVAVTTAQAFEPRPEPIGRSGIWPPLPPPAVVVPAMVDGLGDWVFAGVLVLAAAATLAFPGRSHPHQPRHL